MHVMNNVEGLNTMPRNSILCMIHSTLTKTGQYQKHVTAVLLHVSKLVLTSDFIL